MYIDLDVIIALYGSRQFAKPWGQEKHKNLT